MLVTITFKQVTEKERAALHLLGVHVDRVDGELSFWSEEPSRIHRILGALIDILKLAIVP